MSYSAIRDNHTHGNVGDFLKEAISSNSDVSIVSAYFTIYAYHHLKSNLDGINNLKFLFGEPTFIKSLDPDKINTRDFKIEDDKIAMPIEKRLCQKKIARECAEWIKNKTEIRSMVKPNFLHGKLYHVRQESGIEKAIAGSSNFTVNGLGLGGSKNIELNLIIDSDRDRQELKSWFDSIWNDQTGLVEDVKAQVLTYLEQLYIENDPAFVYFKTLYHIFENYLDEQKKGGLLDEKTGFYDSEIWNMLYDFQKDGVKGAINKILKHNGCIIADSVGLGKTFEALAVIKYFELLNARVLVVCPKKLTGNWTIYQASQNHALNPFKKDRYNYTVLYHTDMGRESGKAAANGIDLENFNWGAYDLVVIDESHNFRGNPMDKVKDDNTVKMNRAKWLMEKVVKSGVKTKVLMLSATPVNNTLRDLRNQIAYITEGKEDALFETCNIKEYTFRDAFEGVRNSPYYQGKMDLWYLFACKNLDYLRKKSGVLCFIATNNWTTNAGASKMRAKILNESTIHSLLDFGSYMIFESADIQTMVMLFINDNTNDNYNFELRRLIGDKIVFDDVLDLITKKPTEITEYLIPLISKENLKDRSFTFSNDVFETILDKIKAKGNFQLNENTEVAQGIVLPQDLLNKPNQKILGDKFRVGQGIFVLSDDEKKNLDFNKKELELIKPYYITKQIHKWYGNEENDEWIIYTDSKFKYTENIKPYPNIKKHLDKFQKVITSDNKPYGLHRAREEYFFKDEKIIVLRKCANEPMFTYTDFDCYVSATFYVIKSEKINLKYLTAILNSKLIAFWLKNKGKMQGNNYQLDKEPLLQIPIFNAKEVKPIITIVDKILSAKAENAQADISALEKQLDEMIYKLYELTEEEIVIVAGK
jgi:hypothetical protein